MDQSSDDRLLDEKQISNLLKRAAELQEENPDSAGIGLTVRELQQIAKEAGIDPGLIAIALEEFDHAGGEKTDLWGGPFSSSMGRSVPGELDVEHWEKMVAASRKSFEEIGHVDVRGNVREWIHAGRNFKARVSAITREGKTKIEVSWAEPVIAVPVYTVSLVLSIIMLPVIFESLGLVNLGGALLYIGIVGMLFMVSRFLTSRMVRAKKTLVKSLMKQLEDIARNPEAVLNSDIGKAQLGDGVETTHQSILDLEDESTPASVVDVPDKVQSKKSRTQQRG